MRGFSTRIRLWDKIGKTMLPSAPLWKVDFVHIEDLERYILMFETGLQDKNGKEIYEGDIVRFGNLEPTFKLPIRFEMGSFGVSGYYLASIYNACEIIGNIHENSELVKE